MSPILPDSVANRDGRLQLGDCIIRVNGVNLVKLRHDVGFDCTMGKNLVLGACKEETANSTEVLLLVARPVGVEDEGGVYPASLLGDDKELDNYLRAGSTGKFRESTSSFF